MDRFLTTLVKSVKILIAHNALVHYRPIVLNVITQCICIKEIVSLRVQTDFSKIMIKLAVTHV